MSAPARPKLGEVPNPMKNGTKLTCDTRQAFSNMRCKIHWQDGSGKKDCRKILMTIGGVTRTQRSAKRDRSQEGPGRDGLKKRG